MRKISRNAYGHLGIVGATVGDERLGPELSVPPPLETDGTPDIEFHPDLIAANKLLDEIEYKYGSEPHVEATHLILINDVASRRLITDSKGYDRNNQIQSVSPLALSTAVLDRMVAAETRIIESRQSPSGYAEEFFESGPASAYQKFSQAVDMPGTKFHKRLVSMLESSKGLLMGGQLDSVQEVAMQIMYRYFINVGDISFPRVLDDIYSHRKPIDEVIEPWLFVECFESKSYWDESFSDQKRIPSLIARNRSWPKIERKQLTWAGYKSAEIQTSKPGPVLDLQTGMLVGQVATSKLILG